MASIRISTRCMTIPYPKVINHTVLPAFYCSIFYRKASIYSPKPHFLHTCGLGLKRAKILLLAYSFLI